jgi:hypothetical protein
MKSRYSKVDSQRGIGVAELLPGQTEDGPARDLALRSRYVRALDRNRNQRQVLTLLLHHGLLLQQRLSAASLQTFEGLLARHLDSLQRISRSLALLWQADDSLKRWHAHRLFLQQKYVSANDKSGVGEHNRRSGAG